MNTDSGELVLPRTFHIVGVRADGSRRLVCSVSTRATAEYLTRLMLPYDDFRRLEIVEKDWPPEYP